MAAYAAATSTAAFDAIRDAASAAEPHKPARSTTEPFRAILERLWILEPVPGWLPSRNHLRELGVSPKHHLVDPALAVLLLGLDERSLLGGQSPPSPAPRDAPSLARCFESLVAAISHASCSRKPGGSE